MKQQTKEPSNGNATKKALIIGLILLLLGLNAILLYFNLKVKKEVVVQKQIVAQKDTVINKYAHQLDSINIVITDKIAIIKELGGDTAELGRIRKELLRDLKSARGARSSDLRKLAQFRAKIEKYTAMLNEKDEEITNLKTENTQLFEETAKLKTRIARTEDSIGQLNKTKEVLSSQVAAASILKAENIKFSFIDKRGKEKTDEENIFKSKKIDKLKISLLISENRVAKIETKTLYMRLLEPEGAVLYDLSTGGGTFMVDGKENYFTAKQDFLFDNKQPVLGFTWAKGSPFKTGQHTIELYCEGFKIGESMFTVK